MIQTVLAFLTELIKSKKRGLWLTVLAITILGSSGFHYAVAKPESQAALSHSIDSLGSKNKSQNEQILNELKSMNKDLANMNKSLEEIKKDLNQTNQNVLDIYKKKK